MPVTDRIQSACLFLHVLRDGQRLSIERTEAGAPLALYSSSPSGYLFVYSVKTISFEFTLHLRLRIIIVCAIAIRRAVIKKTAVQSNGMRKTFKRKVNGN